MKRDSSPWPQATNQPLTANPSVRYRPWPSFRKKLCFRPQLCLELRDARPKKYWYDSLKIEALNVCGFGFTFNTWHAVATARMSAQTHTQPHTHSLVHSHANRIFPREGRLWNFGGPEKISVLKIHVFLCWTFTIHKSEFCFIS